jgi:hypothetical protein
MIVGAGGFDMDKPKPKCSTCGDRGMVSGLFPDLPRTCHCVLSRPLAITASPEPKRSPGVNREGLTWDEWARAAGLERPPMEIILPFPEYEAWQRGEDPTEYKASPSQ